MPRDTLSRPRVIPPTPSHFGRFLWVLSCGIAGLIGFAVFLVMLRQTPPYVVIEANTTYLEQIVDRPAATRFKLGSLHSIRSSGTCGRISSDGATSEALEGVLAEISPAKGAEVSFRWRPEGAAILIKNAGQTGSVGRLSGEKSCDLGSDATLRVALPDANAIVALPISGPVSLGAETASTDYFLGGQISIYGRALLYPYKGALYPATDQSITLAEGGRLSSALQYRDGESWYGAARLTEVGFAVSATTETAQLAIIRAGESRETEPIAVSLLARLFKDPSVAPLSIGMLFVSAVVNLIFVFVSLWPYRPELASEDVRDEHQDPELSEEEPEEIPKEDAGEVQETTDAPEKVVE
mmetsp:Transcript_28896/g.55088  ORF Transcript_28896/g.55088 Transcript_28896/m.55088 type:complete len:354 (-) Transcript_28896:355-1416(-)